MAKDVITRFKLETTGFDSKIKEAAKELSAYSKTATQAKEGFNQFTKANVDAARALGSMTTSATNAKDRAKELVGAFNEAAKAYNQLTKEQQQSDWAKALAGSLTQLQQRIKETKAEMQGLDDSMKGASGGGLFGGDKLSGMLQVFGGNVMTKLAGVGVGFASEMKDMVAQGIELARAGEGIRIAFERLGRGDLLDGLRQATHGTVTDLELMKAAVKFNDFKLPLDELGTMLAFAQQKAKDTGQSVDYMVDSIVTGLGRKSLMILDNLGLSASEVKERMAETGDMTKAVGAIIREQMAKAGDYVETAADRATQANVSLQNKMEELGRKFGPLEQASSNLWTSIKIGIMDIVGGPLTEFINKLTEAGRLAQQYGVLGGSGKVSRLINNLSGAREGNRQSVYQQQQEQFWRYINPREQQIRDIRAWQRGERGEALQKRVSAITDKYGSLDATKIQAEVDAAKKMLNEYIQAAKTVLNVGKGKSPSPTSTTTTPTGGGSGGSNNEPDLSKMTFDPNKAALGAIKADDGGLSDAFAAYKASMEEQTNVVDDLTKAFEHLNKAEGIEPSENKKKGRGREKKNPYIQTDEKGNEKASLAGVMGGMATGMSEMVSGMENLGIEIPKGFKDTISAVQGVVSILNSIVIIVQAIEAISAIDSIIPFAHGGVVKAANGYVSGTTYSGDQIPAMLNAGEVVLNRSQAGVLAASLQAVGQSGEGGGGGRPYVSGELIWLGLNNYLNRSGRGEIVTSKRR